MLGPADLDADSGSRRLPAGRSPARGGDGDRPRADDHRAAAQGWASSASSSSSTGPGLEFLTIADRATLGNMSPEYGATIAICPIDEMTLDYLRLTGRDEAHVQMVEAYAKEQGLFRTARHAGPAYTSTLELDLSTVEPSLAGPKRPQDRVSLRQAKCKFQQALEVMLSEAQDGEGRAARSRARRRVRRRRQPRPSRSRPTPSRPGMEGLDHGVGRRRRDHELHQHLEPERDDWRRAAGAERRPARAEGQAVGEDEPRARIARRHRVLQGGGAARVPRRARVQRRRLRLHDLHRQQRAAARTGVDDRQGQEPGRRVGAERQPQLRGADPVAGARQLPRVAAARRRLRACRADADRHDDRAARRRTRTGSRCT